MHFYEKKGAIITDKEILSVLLPITDEEKEILDGKKTIDRSLYMERSDNMVNSKKLLEMGKLITIRPHTRFIHFPVHTHDYVEVVYMCMGSTTHIVNGNAVVLNEGENTIVLTGKSTSIHRNIYNEIPVPNTESYTITKI